MDNLIKVSVCMITYGHEKFIEQAVNGILMQETDFEVELIISDDCSPDDTSAVVEKILKNHPKSSCIRYLKREKNLGILKNLELALNAGKGEYVAFCDGDDYWIDPLKLQKQVDFLDNHKQYVACGCDVDVLHHGKLEVTQPPYLEASYSQMEVGYGHGFPTVTAVFRNLDFTPFFQYEPLVGDLELYLYLSQFGDFKKLPFVGAVYRYHGSGAVSGNDPYTNKKSFIKAKLKFNKTFKFFPKELYKQHIKKQIKAELYRIPKDILKGRKGFGNSVDYILFCIKQYRSF